MSGPGPGETFHACIEIDGPTDTAEIKKCIAEIKKILLRYMSGVEAEGPEPEGGKVS